MPCQVHRHALHSRLSAFDRFSYPARTASCRLLPAQHVRHALLGPQAPISFSTSCSACTGSPLRQTRTASKQALCQLGLVFLQPDAILVCTARFSDYADRMPARRAVLRLLPLLADLDHAWRTSKNRKHAACRLKFPCNFSCKLQSRLCDMHVLDTHLD